MEALKVLQELRCELRPLTDARETALHVEADFGNSAAVKWPVEEAGFNEASLLRGVGSALEVARSAREMAVVQYLNSVSNCIVFSFLISMYTGTIEIESS